MIIDDILRYSSIEVEFNSGGNMIATHKHYIPPLGYGGNIEYHNAQLMIPQLAKATKSLDFFCLTLNIDNLFISPDLMQDYNSREHLINSIGMSMCDLILPHVITTEANLPKFVHRYRLQQKVNVVPETIKVEHPNFAEVTPIGFGRRPITRTDYRAVFELKLRIFVDTEVYPIKRRMKYFK